MWCLVCLVFFKAFQKQKKEHLSLPNFEWVLSTGARDGWLERVPRGWVLACLWADRIQTGVHRFTSFFPVNMSVPTQLRLVSPFCSAVQGVKGVDM